MDSSREARRISKPEASRKRSLTPSPGRQIKRPVQHAGECEQHVGEPATLNDAAAITAVLLDSPTQHTRAPQLEPALESPNDKPQEAANVSSQLRNQDGSAIAKECSSRDHCPIMDDGVVAVGAVPPGYESMQCDECGSCDLEDNGQQNWHCSACEYDVCSVCRPLSFDHLLDRQQAAAVKATVERLGIAIAQASREAGCSSGGSSSNWLNQRDVEAPSTRTAGAKLLQWHKTAQLRPAPATIGAPRAARVKDTSRSGSVIQALKAAGCHVISKPHGHYEVWNRNKTESAVSLKAASVQFLDDHNAHGRQHDNNVRAIEKPPAATPIGGEDRTDKWWAGLENCDGFNVVCVHPINGDVMKGQLVWNAPYLFGMRNQTPYLVRTEQGQVVTTSEFERMSGCRSKNPKQSIKFAEGERAGLSLKEGAAMSRCVWTCDVCQRETHSSASSIIPDDWLVCTTCKVAVHGECYLADFYGDDQGDNADWKCDRCSTASGETCCHLCGLAVGAMKLISCGEQGSQWVHLKCHAAVSNNFKSNTHFSVY